jgi:hypothetical protein
LLVGKPRAGLNGGPLVCDTHNQHGKLMEVKMDAWIPKKIPAIISGASR